MERNGAQAPRQPSSELFLSAVYRLKSKFYEHTVTYNYLLKTKNLFIIM